MNTNDEHIIDATLLAPQVRHSTIFAQYNALNNGNSFILENNHDPVPLYNQFINQFGETFGWEYLEKGPEWFRIRITKGGSSAQVETLGEIAVNDINKALIFKKYGLNFCCEGKKTIKDACAEKGIDPAIVEAELKQADSSTKDTQLAYDDWNLDFLVDYIVNTHHTFVHKRLPDLKFYAHKVTRKHGHEHPELENIYKLVLKVEEELLAHLDKEENGLFIYIKEMVQASKNPEIKLDSLKAKISNPMNVLVDSQEKIHNQISEYLEEIKKLSLGYTLPADACGSYNLYYRLLKEFEDDLTQHVHLENNILFPKALALESELKKTN